MLKRKSHREAGIFVVIFSLTLPVLLGLVVLAIDSGALYLARLRLTKVARVATGTGMNMMALRGWGAMVANPVLPPEVPNLGLKTANADPDNPEETAGNRALLTEMHQTALNALQTYYPQDFESPNTGARPSYLWYRDRSGNSTPTPSLSSLDLRDSSLGITLRYAVKTYLLSSLAQIIGTSGACNSSDDESGRRCWVESSPTPDGKTGRMRSANVMMLLDVSGSMNESVNGRTKKDALVEAAASFIDMFNPWHDKFAVIPYATTADVGAAPQLTSLLPDSTNTRDYLSAKNSILNYVVGGQTNQCDALVQVIRAINSNSTLQDPNIPKFVLLFTDGAPNVYRLNFCEERDCSQNPMKLRQALRAGSLSENDAAGWYGWTVRWDRREVFRITSPNDTCPTTDGDSTSAQCQDGIDNDGDGRIDLDDPGCKSDIDDDESNNSNGNTAIPECDPVWAFPKVIAGNLGPELTYAEVSNHLRLDETTGEFYFRGGSRDGQTLKELGYNLKFKDWGSTAAAYQALDAFRWHGPSYLVHSSFRVPRGFSLIDRIPTELLGATPPITCGPGSRNPYPGYVTSAEPHVADKYNHSRYFASRVVDANWRWNGAYPDDSEDKADKNGLTNSQLRTTPLYFDLPQPNHTLVGNPHDTPGCLNSLDSKVPFIDAQIHTGENFVSNPAASIRTRGEAVKTAELPYYCALRAADWLRQQYNVVIFVVGLGPSANDIYDQPGKTCEDPLQNALDPNSRKDRFLRRLAFAPESLSDATAIFGDDIQQLSWSKQSDFTFRSRSLDSCQNHPLAGERVESGYNEKDVSKYPGYSPSDHGFTSDHLGAYFHANDPEELKILFGEIAKRVLLRLTT